jgi:glycosyltransferase involved in cell wall biosynthesis
MDHQLELSERYDGCVQPRAHVLCCGGEDHELRIPFLHALVARGFRITAAGTGKAEAFTRAGIDYRPYRFDRFVNPAADRASLGMLAGIVADLRPDIVQSFDTKPNLLVPLALRRMRGPLVVRTINGMGWLYSARSPQALALRPVYRLLHRLAARSTAASIFQNREDHEYFRRHGMLGSAVHDLIPGSGVDIEGFDQALAANPPLARLRDSMGLNGADVIITVTRLTRQKGIATLLEGAALVHRERPHARFLLVGPRESEGKMAISQAEIDRHAPYVIATGRRSDIPALLALADLFAFPTEYREGVPRVLLEAALAGLPIVTTNMPGCSDVVQDGWSGVLVPPRSPRALANGILKLLSDRAAASVMADRASKLVREEFGLQLTADRYARLYTSLLEKRVQSQTGAAASFRTSNSSLPQRQVAA